jgi:DNA-binding HxlR family transcriptional regulator
VGQRPRAGTAVLALFAAPLNAPVLRALANGPKRLSVLRSELGGPAQSTLRGILAKLVEIEALNRGLGDKPSMHAYELTPFGEDLLFAADAVESWLSLAPDGPITLESAPAKVAIKALVGGWASTVVRALAARPLTLTELDKLIDGYTYPALERRLSAMRHAGQIELGMNGDSSKSRQYTVSPWLRLGIGPLTVSARCERKHMANATAPITRIDVESAFLLVVPMLDLDESVSGFCQLAVEAGSGDARQPWAGVGVTVEKGSVSACVARLEPRPENSVTGSAAAWLDAVIGRAPDLLDFGGDSDLGREMVEGIHDVLFSIFAPTQSPG